MASISCDAQTGGSRVSRVGLGSHEEYSSSGNGGGRTPSLPHWLEQEGWGDLRHVPSFLSPIPGCPPCPEVSAWASVNTTYCIGLSHSFPPSGVKTEGSWGPDLREMIKHDLSSWGNKSPEFVWSFPSTGLAFLAVPWCLHLPPSYTHTYLFPDLSFQINQPHPSPATVN